jgi:hypothetical protein
MPKIPTPPFGLFPKKFLLFLIAILVSGLLMSAAAIVAEKPVMDLVGENIISTALIVFVGGFMMSMVYESIRRGDVRKIIMPTLGQILVAIASSFVGGIIVALLLVVTVMVAAALVVLMAMLPLEISQILTLGLGGRVTLLVLVVGITVYGWYINWYLYEKYRGFKI